MKSNGMSLRKSIAQFLFKTGLPNVNGYELWRSMGGVDIECRMGEARSETFGAHSEMLLTILVATQHYYPQVGICCLLRVYYFTHQVDHWSDLNAGIIRYIVMCTSKAQWLTF